MPMKPLQPPRRSRTAFCLLAFLLTGLLPAHPAEPGPPTGHWEGEITLPATRLAIRVDLEHSGDSWAGTIDIPVQGLRGFKLRPVAVDGAAVRFVLPGIPGEPTFKGRLEATGKRMSGDFTQGGQTFPFSLERKTSTAGPGDPPARGLPGKGLAGYWVGALKPSPVIELRLSLEITNAAPGRLEGVMVSLDQGNVRIPLTSVTEDSGTVRLQATAIGGAYDGSLSADGSELSGQWQQGGQKLPLTFKRVEKAPQLVRPQEPTKPYPYLEEEVAFDSVSNSVRLAGTLTRPPGPGPFPAAVLITGSGPQDRDEAIMGHRPFLVLADHLTRQGIAVLRYDDRGIGKSKGDFAKAVHTDFVDDALGAVAWLKTRPDIDAKRLGLIGHSEGGIVAPLAAVRSSDIAFLVLMAGVGVPTDQLLMRQGADLARAMGAGEELIAKSTAMQRETFRVLKEEADPVVAERKLRELTARQLADFTPEQQAALGISKAMIDGQLKAALSPWFRQLLAYDPRPTLRQVKCPVLAINGEKDLQVAAGENLDAIREALLAGGNRDVKTVELPGLNHLFQPCTTGAVSEYGQIEETFSPAALKTISDWIRAHTGL